MAVGHYLSDADAAAIRDSGVPVTMYVAGTDAMIPPATQRKLGELLGGRIIDTKSSHMEAHLAAATELPKHLEAAAAAAAAQAVEAPATS